MDEDVDLAAVILIMMTAVAITANLQPSPHHPYRPPLLYNSSINWSLDSWDDERVRRNLRFTKQEIRQILPLLQLQNVKFRYLIKPSPELSISLLLAKLSTFRPYHQMAYDFGRSPAYISIVINDLLEYLENRYSEGLEWNPMITYERIQLYAKNLRHHCPGESIWGFIDGTFKRTCRPQDRQQFHYSGYKKSHGFKFQAITTPDGLISHISGPWPARINDLTMVRQSGLNRRLKRIFKDRSIYYLFGDQAYKQQHYILAPYPGLPQYLDPQARKFNDEMSRARIAVENTFGLTQNLFTSTAYKYGLKHGLMPISNYFLIACLFTNCFTCIRGNCVSKRFIFKPPTVEEYLTALRAANNSNRMGDMTGDIVQSRAGHIAENMAGDMAGDMARNVVGNVEENIDYILNI
ncbi:hypothetical protein ACJ72_08705 [Emergomyces africanus]|uniref:DDE Tnp4 domain-containing protein n=1 Tax=Emergomyces africanus TaxID=1955775 RepID=A0A1B7NJH6_9EURO|nr:hypothetical protein ACJ72_08705 [Emergomyces africanus]